MSDWRYRERDWDRDRERERDRSPVRNPFVSRSDGRRSPEYLRPPRDGWRDTASDPGRRSPHRSPPMHHSGPASAGARSPRMKSREERGGRDYDSRDTLRDRSRENDRYAPHRKYDDRRDDDRRDYDERPRRSPWYESYDRYDNDYEKRAPPPRPSPRIQQEERYATPYTSPRLRDEDPYILNYDPPARPARLAISPGRSRYSTIDTTIEEAIHIAPVRSRPPPPVEEEDLDDMIVRKIQRAKAAQARRNRAKMLEEQAQQMRYGPRDSMSLPVALPKIKTRSPHFKPLYESFRKAIASPVKLKRCSFGSFQSTDSVKTEKYFSRAKLSIRPKHIRWAIIAIFILALLGVIGGVAAAVVKKKNSVLTKNSPEIRAMLNNKNLHKVFPGFDYTPMNGQYPACLTKPPNQSNVTRDIAMISQLTNQVRLYSTDCGQAQMVLSAIDALSLNGTLKVWLGVQQGLNATSNARQISQLYGILDTYGATSIKGVIVGSNVISRKYMGVSDLASILKSVRTTLASRGFGTLSVSTSDVGTAWSSALAAASDNLMASVQPFYAGQSANVAAQWTSAFWTQVLWPLKPEATKSYISETGWPTQGGTDCGTSTTMCSGGAVASVANLQTFIDDFVCQSLMNGTQYFMYGAFDEPWRTMFDTSTGNWESHWGLMDVNRNLKTGLSLPDCNGFVVPPA